MHISMFHSTRFLSVLVGKELGQVPLSIFWDSLRTMNNYKITESTNSYSSSTENSDNSVPRYYTFDESDFREHFHGTLYLDLSVAAPRIFNKCKVVHSQFSVENQIFGTQILVSHCQKAL